MRYLLDTHAYLWAAQTPSNLSPLVLDIFRNENQEMFLSIASLWEIAIKVGIGKLQPRHSVLELSIDIPAKYGITALPITPQHIDLVSRLPRHHRDPFDRLLVAQAIVENLPIVSGDVAPDAYGIVRIW